MSVLRAERLRKRFASRVAVQDVSLEVASGEVVGEDLRYSLDKRSGMLVAGRTNYDMWYLRGEEMRKIAPSTFLLEEGTFTTDELDPPTYHFESDHIKLRQDEVIVAQPVVLYVSDVPIFYLPWYIEPLGRDRKSGILRPNIGLNTLINAEGGERNVQDLGLYWAISDFMDSQLALTDSHPVRSPQPGWTHLTCSPLAQTASISSRSRLSKAR